MIVTGILSMYEYSKSIYNKNDVIDNSKRDTVELPTVLIC